MSLICKAALADGRRNFIIDEIEINEPQADEVIVKMKPQASAIQIMIL